MSKEDFVTPEEEREARQLLARPIDWISIPAGATEVGVIKWIRDAFGVNDARALKWWKAARLRDRIRALAKTLEFDGLRGEPGVRKPR